MNEFNHKNIIRQLPLASFCKSKTNKEVLEIPLAIASILKDASNFTDSVISLPKQDSPSDYFFFHFYYNIDVEGNQISLTRVDEESRSSVDDMNKCDSDFDSATQEKLFFTKINNRKEPGLTDVGNQGDEVSFLHAMAEKEIREKTPQVDFKEHLKKCFKEYLFLTDPKRANFILGIAMHGIMDSFTPSHMGFQKYALQDWGLHAQGDVIPIIGQTESAPVLFDPGQFLEETFVRQRFCRIKKNYGICYGVVLEKLNSTEFKMLKIFIIIGDLVFKDASSDKAAYLGRLNPELLDNFMKMKFGGKNIKQVNEELSRKYTTPNGTQHYCYSYGARSYVFSACAIEAIVDIYSTLVNLKKDVTTYDKYKNLVTEEQMDQIVQIWVDYYNGKKRPTLGIWKDWLNREGFKDDSFFNTEDMIISEIRKHHLSLHLYDKKRKNLV